MRRPSARHAPTDTATRPDGTPPGTVVYIWTERGTNPLPYLRSIINSFLPLFKHKGGGIYIKYDVFSFIECAGHILLYAGDKAPYAEAPLTDLHNSGAGRLFGRSTGAAPTPVMRRTPRLSYLSVRTGWVFRDPTRVPPPCGVLVYRVCAIVLLAVATAARSRGADVDAVEILVDGVVFTIAKINLVGILGHRPQIEQ